jgi:hypothetical protein
MVLRTQAKIEEELAVVFPTITKISENSTTFNRKPNNGPPNTSEGHVTINSGFPNTPEVYRKPLFSIITKRSFLPAEVIDQIYKCILMKT